MNRKHFIKLSSLFAGLAAVGGRSGAARAQTLPVERTKVRHRTPCLAIQVGAVSFVDEGTDKVLDILQEKAHINTIWLNTYTWERGTGGRQFPGQPMPDHGVQEYDPDFHGGAFYDYDRKFFKNTILDDFRSPDYNGINILNEVLPKAKQRGIDVFAMDMNSNSAPMKNWSRVTEIDMHGRRTSIACYNNEDYRQHLYGKIHDYLKTYPDLAGVAWINERMGPLMNLIGGGWTSPFASCFCADCRLKARERDISPERAREGFMQVEKLFAAAKAAERPTDGYFVSFWRLLIKYPEILAWEKLWTDSYHEVRRQVYALAKAIAPEKPLGWHVMHNAALNPLYRAEEDFGELRQYADFAKIALYNTCGGERMVREIDRLGLTLFRDAQPQDFLSLYYRIMNYEEAPTRDALPRTGLSPDFVSRETKRAVAGLGPDVPVYPGIDIDIPSQSGAMKTTPDRVRLAVKAALSAGASGVILSRKYSEMNLTNLAGAGAAFREAGLA